MSGRVLFQMWSGFREQLIEKHEFYVEQARSRLLGQFTDDAISQEADRVADESWQARGRSFDPDFDDPLDGAEEAYEDGVWRYQLLCELRDNVRMNIIAGFFHEWEKELRQWLILEVAHWHSGSGAKAKIWRAKVDDLYELLESFGWPLKSAPWFADLNACQLVVNVHKHGDGPSLDNLHKAFPRFLLHPLAGMLDDDSNLFERQSHEHLSVTDADLDKFAEAVSRFWRELPENTQSSQITTPPTWFIKAIEKDRQTSGAV